jgi:hypothetical protein
VVAQLVKLYSLSSSTLGFGFGIRPALTPQQFVVMPDVEARSAVCRAARGGHLPVVQLFGPEFHKTLAPGYDTINDNTHDTTRPDQRQHTRHDTTNDTTRAQDQLAHTGSYATRCGRLRRRGTTR